MKQQISRILPKRFYQELLHFYCKYFQSNFYKSFQEQMKVITNDGYSLKPFIDNKAIFVHIPKCAGVSVNKTLFGNLAGGHKTFDLYLRIFPPKSINEYFKFTIVRNPWDRLVSAFHFLKKGGMNESDKKWSENELSQYDNFDQFVNGWLNKENIWKCHHFKPQYHYMLDSNNKVFLDFVGFLENIDDDFLYITNQIGIKVDLPKSNTSKHKLYTDYYSEETKNIVNQIYSDDIKLLGYTFDNSSLSEQIKNRSEVVYTK